MAMKTWNAFMKGEDGMDFTVEVQANSISEAREILEEDYPESRIEQIFDPIEREREIYERANRLYDDPYNNDDYDY
jgi:hypothetical protein